MQVQVLIETKTIDERGTEILVVDDQPELSSAYAHILSSAGFKTAQAHTGADAIRLTRELKPDLVLLDVALPDMSGLECCRHIKADSELLHTFIIHLSGTQTSSDAQAEGLEAGADGFLTKPIQRRTLLAYVNALLRIKSAEEELRKSEERHRLLANELLESNRRLEEYNRLKAEFVANMSHELRTPLTAIIGFSQLAQLTSGAELPPSAVDAFDRILRNGRHLLSLVDDVLDISKIEAGRMKLHCEHFDVAEVVGAAFNELQSLATRKGLDYQFYPRVSLPLAFTDPLRVRQIIINLLSNAIKFTAQGSVTIELSSAEEGEFRILVSDTGIGIEQRALDLIFERFRQVDGSRTRSAGGAGLGLSIAGKIVNLLGGRITVVSTPGEGSTFEVAIPLVAPEATQQDTSDSHDFNPLDVGVMEFGPEGNGALERDGRPLVLVVEDDNDAAQLLSHTISRAGYQVMVATDGNKGLGLAREFIPSIITLDVMMPGHDGWQTLKALKQDARTAQIPVIICSIVDNRVLGYNLGASDYLLKPVEPQRLVSALQNVNTTSIDGDESYVLVVDDEHGVRDLLTHALRNAGFTVRSAASGEMALKMMAHAPPRVVLCDLMLPGRMSGFELIARVRHQPATKETPIIVVTGKDMTPADRRLVTGEIADVIRKGDLFMANIEERLRQTLEELGVKPLHGENTGS